MKWRYSIVAVAIGAAALSGFAAVRGQEQTAVVAPVVRENPAPHPAPEQPLPFSHKLHVETGLGCQNCHTNPDPGSQMSFPSTATCMTCHESIATDRPAIKKLTEYANSKGLIPWVRVYKVLPGVTWTHRKHLQAGLKCETCHGAVGGLTAMAQITAVTAMASCTGCHEARHANVACTACHAWPPN